ncbi:MAG: hypothetical protein IJR82_02185 [Bacilli bacterium]|nr:hypothetical protein [Bacilli bacterium]
MKQNKILLSILFAFLLIVIPSKALALTNLTQEDFDEVNEEKGISISEGDEYYLILESGEYVLDENIELNDLIVIPDKEEVSIDLNGKMISRKGEYPFVFGIDGKLTLTGKGNVGKEVEELAEDSEDAVVMESYHGELIIDDIIVNGIVESNYGKLTIKKGTFNDVIYFNTSKLTIEDGIYNGLILGGKLDVTINGGKFNKSLRPLGIGIAIDDEADEPSQEEAKELTAAPAITYMGGMIEPMPIDDDDTETLINSLVINDGEFEGGMAALRIWGMDNVTINGGTFNANVDAVILTAQNIKVTGGIFKITENALFTKYSKDALRTAIGLNGENIELSGGKFVSDENGYSMVILGENDKVFENALKDGYLYSDEISVKEYEYDEEVSEDEPSVWYLDNKEIMVIPEEGEYEILEGADQEVKSSQNLTVRANGDISLFVKLLIDDKEVARDNYELTEGSTIVTLNSSFLATLATGKHNMTFVYKNGEVKTTFTINDTKNPATGDNILLYVGLLSLSVVGLVSYKLVRKAN